MLIKDLKNKRIMLWGLGSEGTSVLRFLEKHDMVQNIIIYGDQPVSLPTEFSGYQTYTGNDFAALLDKTDVIIKSPGVSLYKKEIADARSKGIQITSSTDIFMNEVRTSRPQCKIIAISGSKGKSTSAGALHHILQKFGLNVALGGNIGKPLIELVDGNYDYIVAEISSYQAADLTASPQIAMFTNLFFVHSAWHLNHENYCRDKLHLIARQQPGDICFINARNKELTGYAAEYPGKHIEYDNIPEGFHREGRKLFWQDKEILDIAQLKVCGDHNLDNFAGIFSILHFLGLDISRAAEYLQSFEPLAHRLQKVAVINNVTFINDSISTAPEAAIGAMQSFDDNLAVISGGEENTQDYREYAEYIEKNPKVKMAVTLFQCGPEIAKAIRSRVHRPDFILLEAQSLPEAVNAAYQKMLTYGKGTILFSPTSPSFGFYKNFMERGQHFIDIVNQLGYK